VIAIENVRLFTELGTRNRALTQALDRERATGEVLRVISASPTTVEPVFETILSSALRLCEAPVGLLLLYENETFRLGAARGAPASFIEQFPRRASPGVGLARAVAARAPIQVLDTLADPAYAEGTPARRATVELLGARTAVWVPMLREGEPVGVICTWRHEVRAFTEAEVDLLATFAAQAVIAIENVRLFNETKEALERQTATADILRVISSSPTDTQPVFDTIAQRAVRVCDGTHCVVTRFDGALIHIVAHHGLPAELLEEFRRIYPVPLTAENLPARAIREGTLIHSPDLRNDPSERVRRLAQVGRYRSGIVVPMLRSGSAVGVISVARGGPDGGPRPYTEKEITLLQTSPIRPSSRSRTCGCSRNSRPRTAT
jgi:two-component system NtrC family sensor kinase